MKGCTYWDTKLVKNLAEELHLLLHLVPALVPEANLVCLLKRNGSSLLERRNTAIANARVRTSNVFDQMLRSNQVAHTPAGGVEGFASRAHSEGALVQLGRQGGNSGKGNIEKAVINFIGQDNKVVLDTEVTNPLQLLLGEDLANGVVAMKNVQYGEMGEEKN